ncbi:MAG: hypothetical protein ACRDUS_19030 [Mycobacterium sp.]
MFATAIVGVGEVGLTSAAAAISMAESHSVTSGTATDYQTVPVRIRLASNDSGPNNPDSDVSGPYDSDETNVAPKAPSSGTGMECEDQGVGCDHDQSGSVLTSDNDEV